MPGPITQSTSAASTKKCLSDYMTVESGFYGYVVVGGFFGGVLSLYRQGAFGNTKCSSRPSHFGHGPIPSSDDDDDSDDDSDNHQGLSMTNRDVTVGNQGGSSYSTRSPATLAAIRQNSTLVQRALGKIDSLEKTVNTHYFTDARY